ncbi:hypothetical protein A2U01_0103461, partial [Trifolium medium]|nr:hypothetical protein [Trifolium medium]
AKKVSETHEDGRLHPTCGLSLTYFNNKYERGEVIHPVVPGDEVDEVAHEEEEMNRFESGTHPDQQQVPEVPCYT